MVSVDYASPAVFTRSAFHAHGCRHIKLAESPETQPAWLSFYLITPPCRTCHTSRESNAWLQRLRWFHQNCGPHSEFGLDQASAQPKQRVGRPRKLSREALERVLTLRQTGHGYRSTALELKRAGIDVSWETVRHAIKRQGAYSSDTGW